MIDFGLNDINVDLGIEETKSKKSKPLDPKDQFQMNELADEMKKDVQNTVDGIKKDIELIKKDYLAIKGEVMPIVNYLKDYSSNKKAKQEAKNIIAFSKTVSAKRKQKEDKETPQSLKDRYPLMKSHTENP